MPEEAFCKAPMANSISEKTSLLTAATDKQNYNRNDHLSLCVSLRNSSGKRIHLRREAGWGESSSVSIWIIDTASGKDAGSDFIPDDIDGPIGNDHLIAVDAGAQIFWRFVIPLAGYKLQRGHSYKALAIYHNNVMIPTSNGRGPQIGGRLEAEAFSQPFIVH
jgi:hypothetical protein